MDVETCPDFDDIDRARFARAVIVMQEGPHCFLPGVAWFPCRMCAGSGEVRWHGHDLRTGRMFGLGFAVCRGCSGHGVIAWAPRRG